jgi:hypothetical protein
VYKVNADIGLNGLTRGTAAFTSYKDSFPEVLTEEYPRLKNILERCSDY